LVELVERIMAEPLPNPNPDTERMARGSLLREALVALEKIGSEGALPVLRRVVESKEAGHLRMAAGRAWAIIDLDSAVPALQKLFAGPASLDYFGFLTPDLISVISNEADELIPTLRTLTLEGSSAERIAA